MIIFLVKKVPHDTKNEGHILMQFYTVMNLGWFHEWNKAACI